MLLDINKFIEDNELKPITTSNIMIGNKFDPNGLFSNIIFGLLGSSKWRTQYAYIDLRSYILHPILYEIADRRCSTLLKLLEGKLSIYNDKLIQNNTGNWGIKYFYENTEYCVKILKNSKLLTKAGETLCNYIIKYKKKTFINNMIVLPPQFRPVRIENTRMELHPVNDKYNNMLNEAHVLSTTDITSKSYNEILFKLQNYVFEAYQILRDMIKGKTGIQRKSLLGKTMDFSARAVIVGDPEILPDHVGVPFRIALSLFKPFIIYKSTTTYMSRWQALGVDRPSILTIGHLITMVHEGKRELLDPSIIQLFLDILHEICKERVVILKRDPALHKLSLRAFYVTILFTDSFHINPLVTEGFNADRLPSLSALLVTAC